MNKTESIIVKVDKETKKNLSHICIEKDVSMSNLIRAFIDNVIKESHTVTEYKYHLSEDMQNM